MDAPNVPIGPCNELVTHSWPPLCDPKRVPVDNEKMIGFDLNEGIDVSYLRATTLLAGTMMW